MHGIREVFQEDPDATALSDLASGRLQQAVYRCHALVTVRNRRTHKAENDGQSRGPGAPRLQAHSGRAVPPSVVGPVGDLANFTEGIVVDPLAHRSGRGVAEVRPASEQTALARGAEVAFLVGTPPRDIHPGGGLATRRCVAMCAEIRRCMATQRCPAMPPGGRRAGLGDKMRHLRGAREEDDAPGLKPAALAAPAAGVGEIVQHRFHAPVDIGQCRPIGRRRRPEWRRIAPGRRKHVPRSPRRLFDTLGGYVGFLGFCLLQTFISRRRASICSRAYSGPRPMPGQRRDTSSHASGLARLLGQNGHVRHWSGRVS